MIGLLLVAAAVAGGALLINVIRKSSRTNQGLQIDRRLLRRTPPAALGVRPGQPAEQAAVRLESSLPPDMEARVKDRVLKNRPGMKDREWDWIWFELKRFFLMSAVMRSVNMYSARVDKAWHEFLMFSREYQQFCERFCGAMIHHAPHAPRSDARLQTQEREERAWFDWVYGELFEPDQASGSIWGSFYRYPLPQAVIKEFEQADHETLKQSFFNPAATAAFPDLQAVADMLIDRMKRQIKEAKTHHERGERPGRESFDPTGIGVLGGAMIFASMAGDPHIYDEYMRDQQLNRQSGSSCGASVYGGDDDKNGGGNGSSCSSDGDSGSGSSCGSSCSGGCSS
ncbi:hypothetical protein AB6A23_01650 [Paenibacillus tarimensis]